MMKLYISKGSSALAPHILLEEAKADYTTINVPIAGNEHHTKAFHQINPKGRLPVLDTGQGVISETPAILEYIAATHGDKGLIPPDNLGQAKARELCFYLCATVHVAFAHGRRGSRWADTDGARTDMARKAPQNLLDCAAYLERTLPLCPWALGNTYSFYDPYLFLVGRWLAMSDLTLDPFPKLAAHATKMRARRATRAALAAHNLP